METQNKELPFEIADWSAFDEGIKSGTFKLTTVAKSMNVQPASLRKALVDHYGDKIIFKKGKKGGVYFKE